MRLPHRIGCYALILAMASIVPAAGDDAASGRRIFTSGGPADEVIATFAGSAVSLPRRLRRCAGCHGPDGQGTQEGGVAIPPISWRALSTPRDASAARPGRPAYDEAAFLRALRDGIDSGGRPFVPAMPHFQLRPDQASALLEYLRVVGSERDLEPGVSSDEIRVGVVLPLSGPDAARGRAMRDGLASALAAAGAIYGRRLQLVAVDAGDDVAAALRSLLADDQVFALIGTQLPTSIAEIDTDIPVIGPLQPTAARPAPNMIYLRAPPEDQMRVLVDELADEIPHPLLLAIVGPDGSVVEAVADQARRRGAAVVRHVKSADGPLQVAPDESPDAVIILPGANSGRIAAALAEQAGTELIAGTVDIVTPGTATDERLRLVLPILPTAPHGDDPPATSATPPAAIAATTVLIEALKRMGARVSRAGLIATIETMHDVQTGVLPPLNFGRNRHIGSFASVVVRPDRSHGMIVLRDWRTPP